MGNEPIGSGRTDRVLHRVALALIIVVALMLIYRLAPRPAVGPAPTLRAAGAVQPPRVPPAPPPPVPLPAEPLSLDGAALRGSRDAPVALLEYSDFQCPFCARFARDTLPALETQYVTPGRVLLAFRQNPLRSIHPFAGQAAEAAACAGAQGQFWPMHDALFADPRALDEPSLRARAAALGLDTAAFGRCLGGEKAAQIAVDEASGRQLGVRGTPTFFLGTLAADGRLKVTERLTGAASVDQFRAAIDRTLAAAAMPAAQPGDAR